MEERITIDWGKHKNGKNQLQKAGKTREKLEKNKKANAAAYVSADSVGLLFSFWNGKKRVVSVAVVELESWCVSFLFYRLVRSIHPVDVWTKDESFFHPPSSTAGILPNS